jgi:hypothetical protein
MNEGIWFSYILGPAADGILEYFRLELRYLEPCGAIPSWRCLVFLSCDPTVPDVLDRSVDDTVTA